ncbi:MAG: stage sporulation protein [Clostridia bacterium]|nr:stage sporulation protein [Clostridia bacterium]
MSQNNWPGFKLPKQPPGYLWLALAAVIIGSLLISLGNFSKDNQSHVGQLSAQSVNPTIRSGQETDLMATAREMEAQLQGILEKISGAGKVSVRVSLKASPLKEFATNERTTRHNVEENDQSGGTRITTDIDTDAQLVMARSGNVGAGEVPVVERELHPEIMGVVVVAEGANDALVRARLSQAVGTLWGLALHQIRVLPMEIEGSNNR